jgi:SAM-dependent methyltransferase
MINIAMEDVGCPLECVRADEVVLTGTDQLHGLPGAFTVVRCRSCGLMRTNPRPVPSAMNFYYPDDYGPHLGTRVPANGIRKKHFAELRNTAKKILEFNSMRLPIMSVGRMLEIGCAAGSFMHEMAAKGWQVQGVEVSPAAAAEAASLGHTVHVGTLEDAPAPLEAFDLIVGWMVLEHLHQPMLALKKLKEWAKPDGWLVLSVPNAGSWDFRVFRNKWYALQLPTHLYHYTKTTIALTLAAAGWQLEQVYFHRVLVDPIASFGYILRDMGIKRVGRKLIRFPEHALYWNCALFPLGAAAAAMGQTGRMTIWARKAP